MNAGVKLAAGSEQQVVDSIKALAERGVRVLVCGTCLNFFGLTEQLAVGAPSAICMRYCPLCNRREKLSRFELCMSIKNGRVI
jgi:hypothetical protein